VRWKYQTTSVPTDIIRAGENIFFGSFQDRWSAMNLQTGRLVWDFSTGTSNEGCAMVKSPVADETNFYFIGLDGAIYSLNAKSGRLVWKRKLPASPSTALLMKGKLIFVGTTDKRIYRLNSQTGEIEAETVIEAQPVGRPTWADNAIVFFLENQSERRGYIVSISSDLAKINWTQKQSPEWASERPHVVDGLVLAGNCRGELAAFRMSDGAPEWKVTLKGCIRSIGSSDDQVFVGVQEGTVYALRQ
jgi:outer membrane protein assembly factor BamB